MTRRRSGGVRVVSSVVATECRSPHVAILVDSADTRSEVALSDSNKVYRHVQIGYTVLAAMLVGLLIVGIILRSFNHQVPHGLPRTISLALLSAVALFLVACLV